MSDVKACAWIVLATNQRQSACHGRGEASTRMKSVSGAAGGSSLSDGTEIALRLSKVQSCKGF
ncbi:hypothetical protein H6F86_00330 [Phormidium sp. FACHB-592]|uniref:hypothetical protein n=1 Tax=Cyanophyceae TaxID=3028117 RepID=UPI0016836686|nr:hypothetical protein [Phormidium sp. FACHB-592]MBD2072380.1 hypothetical protein [Phormidium sp. FACHB-592]